MKTVEIFKSLISDYLIREHHFESNNKLLVFQGFPLDFYNALNELGIEHFSAKWDGNYIDYNKINSKAP